MNKKRGFTLIELLAVIIVLAIIMGIVIIGIGKVVYESRVKTFRATASSLISGMRNQLSFYDKVENGDYTFTSDILESGGTVSPFNNPYHFANNFNSFCTGSGDSKIGNYICKKGTSLECSVGIEESFIRISGSRSYSVCLTDGEYYIDADEASINNTEIMHDQTSAITPEPTNTVSPSPQTITVTSPEVNPNTLTYTGNGQTLFNSTGSCSEGGTMYWYGVPSITQTTAPAFSTSTWTTTAPSLSGTNAGTYYLYYYCYVPNPEPDSGTDINTVKNVSKEIERAKTATTGSCENPTFTGSTLTLASGGNNVTYSNNSQTYVGSSDYAVSVTPNDNYAWSDGTIEAQTLNCNITPRETDCISTGAGKTYDGNPLTSPGGSCMGLPDGYTPTFTNTGSITNVGSTSNTISSVVIKDSDNTDRSNNFTIIKHTGTLSISPAPQSISLSSSNGTNKCLSENYTTITATVHKDATVTCSSDTTTIAKCTVGGSTVSGSTKKVQITIQGVKSGSANLTIKATRTNYSDATATYSSKVVCWKHKTNYETNMSCRNNCPTTYCGGKGYACTKSDSSQPTSSGCTDSACTNCWCKQ